MITRIREQKQNFQDKALNENGSIENCSERLLASQDVEDSEENCEKQENVDERTSDMKAPANDPEDHHDDNEGPQHPFAPIFEKACSP
jgi:hypothetical protein